MAKKRIHWVLIETTDGFVRYISLDAYGNVKQVHYTGNRQLAQTFQGEGSAIERAKALSRHRKENVKIVDLDPGYKKNPSKKFPFKLGDRVRDTSVSWDRSGKVTFLRGHQGGGAEKQIRVEEANGRQTWWNVGPHIIKIKVLKKNPAPGLRERSDKLHKIRLKLLTQLKKAERPGSGASGALVDSLRHKLIRLDSMIHEAAGKFFSRKFKVNPGLIHPETPEQMRARGRMIYRKQRDISLRKQDLINEMRRQLREVRGRIQRVGIDNLKHPTTEKKELLKKLDKHARRIMRRLEKFGVYL